MIELKVGDWVNAYSGTAKDKGKVSHIMKNDIVEVAFSNCTVEYHRKQLRKLTKPKGKRITRAQFENAWFNHVGGINDRCKDIADELGLE